MCVCVYVCIYLGRGLAGGGGWKKTVQRLILCVCVRKTVWVWKKQDSRPHTIDQVEKNLGWKGATTDSCQRGWMALIEKTPGFTPEGRTHTLTPLDSWDCSKKAFILNEGWSLCARMHASKAVRMCVSLPNICVLLDYLWDFDLAGRIFLFSHRLWSSGHCRFSIAIHLKDFFILSEATLLCPVWKPRNCTLAFIRLSKYFIESNVLLIN